MPNPANLHQRAPFRRVFSSFASWSKGALGPGAVLLASMMGAPAFAQSTTQPAPADDERDNAVTVIFANDSIGNPSNDRYFTSGQRITLDLADGQAPLLDSGFAALGFDAPDRRMLSIAQEIHTPDKIWLADHADGSRPWAGWLGFTAAAAQERASGAVDSIEISAGVVGPASYAEDAQKWVHENFNGATPRGWDKQLKNEPTLNVTLGRHWPGLAETKLGRTGIHAAASPYLLGALGTWERSATGGVLLAIGSDGDIAKARPDQAQPGRGVLGLNNTGSGDFGWTLYAGHEVRGVEHYTPIDGNTWTASNSATLEHFQQESYAGIALRYKGTTLRSEAVSRTAEFADQDGDHTHIRLSVTRNF